jgi:hypothetical protein
MLAYAIDNPAPTTIVLISGDRDFAYALSILRFRRYRIVLITLSNAHQSLRAQASISFDWVSEILEPVDPTLSNQPTSGSPRRRKISSPPAHDKFYSDSMGHNPSSSLFQESYDEKSTNSVEFMNSFQDETRCTEIPRIPSKHDVKHDSLPPYLERQLAASSMALNNGPEAPARVVHSPVASFHTYPNGSIHTPLATTSCSSESNFSSRTTLTQTCPSQALQNSRLMETSCRLDVLCENPPLIHEPSPLSHQQSSPSPMYATQRLSSVDRMAVDDNHPGSRLAQSPPANVTAKVTAPAPSLIPPPSSTLSSATVSATPQTPANPFQPHPSISFLVVPDQFKILVQCLNLHRSKGRLRPLRSNVALEVACNGTTYRQAGVLKFSQYVAMAEKAGIVETGGSEAAAWICLKAPWCNY